MLVYARARVCSCTTLYAETAAVGVGDQEGCVVCVVCAGFADACMYVVLGVGNFPIFAVFRGFPGGYL